jgi:hypothetical protein
MSGRQCKAVRSSTGFGSGKMGGKPHAVHVRILQQAKKKRRAEQEAGSLPMKQCPKCKNPQSHKAHTCGFGQKNKNSTLLRAPAKGSGGVVSDGEGGGGEDLLSGSKRKADDGGMVAHEEAMVEDGSDAERERLKKHARLRNLMMGTSMGEGGGEEEEDDSDEGGGARSWEAGIQALNPNP